MRTRPLLALTALALAAPLNGCRPTRASATVRAEDTFLVAAGDTLKATQFYTVTGSPDSVRWLFSVPGAPSVVVSRLTPPNGVSLTAGPVSLIPAPPLADGATVTVTACPTAFKAGSGFAGACSTKSYTKPIPPPTVTGDSLTVIGLDLYPKGNWATVQATGACLRTASFANQNSGWINAWDAPTNTWKPVCRGANGAPMVLAICAAVVMGDSVRVLTAQWLTRPWCAQYTAQVPRRYTWTGLYPRRQQVADAHVIWMEARTAAGVPPAGFVWEERFALTIARDTVTPTLPGDWVVGFAVARPPPDSTVLLVARIMDRAGRPIAGRVVTWAVSTGGGALSAADLRWGEWQLGAGGS